MPAAPPAAAHRHRLHVPTCAPQAMPDGRRRQQVCIIQEYCSRGDLLAAIDRGLLHHGGGAGGVNLPALLAAAQEIAGACRSRRG